jgi:hypothetical protein
MYSPQKPEGSKQLVWDIPEGGFKTRGTAIELLMLRLFHKVRDDDITILDGIWYNNANPIMCDIMKESYERRLDEQAKGSPLESVLKLFMNSGYGKLSQNLIPKNYKSLYYSSDKHLKEIISREGSKLMSYTTLGDGHHVIVESHATKKHWNRNHLSSFILDSSKLIMYFLYDAVEAVGGRVLYSDTDSCHIEEKYMKPALEMVNTKWGEHRDFLGLPRGMMGKGLYQFKSDFKLSGGHRADKETEPVSVMFIGLGPKAYMHKIMFIEGGETKYQYTYKIKGIPTSSITAYLNRHGLTAEELYNKLYDGEAITFNLLDGDRVSFDKDKAGNVFSVASFTRTVKY